jgi:O-antigen/teichoic acid export membrane protein
VIKAGLRAISRRSTLAYFPTKILPAIVGIIAFPILTRWFTPDIYGRYTFILALVALAGNLGGGWLFQSILRFYKGDPADGEWLPFFRRGIGTGILLFLIWMIVFSFPNDYSEYRLPAGLFILLYIPFRALNTMDRVEQRPFRYSLLDSGLIGGKFILGILFIWLTGKQAGLDSIFVGGVIIMLCAVAILYFGKMRQLDRTLSPPEPITWRRLITYGFPLGLAQVAVWLFSMSDVILLKYLMNDHAVGIYATINGVLDKSVRIVPISIMLIAWPALVRIHRNEGMEHALREQLVQVRIYMAFMIPLVILVMIFGGWGFRILVDELYWGGTILIVPLALAFFFSGLSQYYLNIFNLAEKSYLVTIGMLAAGSVKILLSLLLIPHFEILGAAWSTLIAFASLALWAIYMSHRKQGAHLLWRSC